MSISDNHDFELIPPAKMSRRESNVHKSAMSKAGSAYIELYVLPWEMADARLTFTDAAGHGFVPKRILADFQCAGRGQTQRLEGYIRYDHLAADGGQNGPWCRMKYSLCFVNELRQRDSR